MSNEANKSMTQAQREAVFTAAEEETRAVEPRKAALLASVRRLHYDASIRKGFTPDQALALCMKPSFD